MFTLLLEKPEDLAILAQRYDALVADGRLNEREALIHYSNLTGHKMVDLLLEPCDPSLFTEDNFNISTKHSIVPWRVIDNEIFYATWRAWDTNYQKLKIVYAAKHQVLRAIDYGYASLTSSLLQRQNCAIEDKSVSARLFPQKSFIALMLLWLIAGLFFPNPFLISNAIIVALCTVLSTVFTSLVTSNSKFNYDMIDLEAQTEYPIYTIIVPLYKETKILTQLFTALLAIDYPVDKLDIKIVVEANDFEMINSISALLLPRHFNLMLVPPGSPQTKARACNYALFFAKGRYLVIFDAEDIPDPDQLKKALALFTARPNLACLQSRLSIYNSNTNLLTKMFALEYGIWHRIRLLGMKNIGIPLPLCGTSNHFCVDKLRSIGGWDAYNVTEDAELGMRFYAKGLEIDFLDSDTWEEAPAILSNWFTQRTRWIKGFMVTYLCYMRHPRFMLSKLGVGGLAGMSMLFFVAQFLSNISGAYVVIWALFCHGNFLWFGALMSLMNIAVHLLQMVVFCRRYGSNKMMLLALPYLIYLFILLPLAAILAGIKICFSPHSWEKTLHTGIRSSS